MQRFEACCQWALLTNVQIITLLFTFTVQKYIYPSVKLYMKENFESAGEWTFS